MALDFDFDNPQFKQSLDETIVWCSRPQLAPGSAEAADLKRCVRLVDEAGELMLQAYRDSQRFWNRLLRRNYRQMTKWQRGVDLMSEASASSAASYLRKLRTPLLEPFHPVEARIMERYEHIVRTLVIKRAELLKTLEFVQRKPDRSQGRLLVYWPEETLADGAAENHSCGFFDGDNTPPWDTWVIFSNRALLSWVPAIVIELVQKGIDANPEKCIEWLD